METYPLRYRIWLGAALFHLTLVILGANYVGYEKLGPLSKVFDFYGALSGAGSAYGFFAPGIHGQLRALFDVTRPDGSVQTVHLESGESHEADLRVGNIIDQFAEGEYDPVELQRSLSSSLARTIFMRNPGSRAVAVQLDEFLPVSMGEYRAGRRPEWHSVYQAKYVLNKEGPGTK